MMIGMTALIPESQYVKIFYQHVQNAPRLPPAKLSNSIKKHALQDFRQNTNGNMIFLANVVI